MDISFVAVGILWPNVGFRNRFIFGHNQKNNSMPRINKFSRLDAQ